MGVIENGTFVVLYINGRRTHVVPVEDGIAQAKLDIAFQVVTDPNSADLWARDADEARWAEQNHGNEILAQMQTHRLRAATLQRENDVLRGLPPCAHPKCESRGRNTLDGTPLCERHYEDATSGLRCEKKV